jgi:hypothetical protein
MYSGSYWPTFQTSLLSPPLGRWRKQPPLKRCNIPEDSHRHVQNTLMVKKETKHFDNSSRTLSTSSVKIPLRLSGSFRWTVVVTGLEVAEVSYVQMIQIVTTRYGYHVSDTSTWWNNLHILKSSKLAWPFLFCNKIIGLGERNLYQAYLYVVYVSASCCDQDRSLSNRSLFLANSQLKEYFPAISSTL